MSHHDRDECHLRVLGGRTPETEHERRYIAEACRLQDGPVKSFAELKKQLQEYDRWNEAIGFQAGMLAGMGKKFLLNQSAEQLKNRLKRQFPITVAKRLALIDDAHWVHPKPFPKSAKHTQHCLLYTSPSPRDRQKSRMPSSA